MGMESGERVWSRGVGRRVRQMEQASTGVGCGEEE